MPREENRSPARSYGQGYAYVGVAFSFAGAMLLFGGIGWLVDGWLGTRPLFAIAGGLLGGFAAFMSLYYRVRRDTERERDKKGDVGRGTREG